MKINYISLMNALAKIDIPPPEHPDQTMRIAFPSRVDELNMEIGRFDERDETGVMNCLTLIAQWYAIDNRKWLEWEIDFGS